MIPRTSARPTGSSADVGSSRKTSSGRPSRATPRPSRCCMPFENAPDEVAGPVGRARRSSSAARDLGCLSAGRAGQRAVEREHLARPQPGLVAEELRQVAHPTPGPRSPSGAPSTVPLPPVGRASPSSSLTAVVLPAPFGPRKPKTSPGRRASSGRPAPRPSVALDQVDGLDRRLIVGIVPETVEPRSVTR